MNPTSNLSAAPLHVPILDHQKTVDELLAYSREDIIVLLNDSNQQLFNINLVKVALAHCRDPEANNIEIFGHIENYFKRFPTISEHSVFTKVEVDKFEVFKKVVDAHHLRGGQYDIGMHYLKREPRTTQDYVTAIGYLRDSAEAGYSEAIIELTNNHPDLVTSHYCFAPPPHCKGISTTNQDAAVKESGLLNGALKLTDIQWEMLGNAVLDASALGYTEKAILLKAFYQDIYEQATVHINYAKSNDSEQQWKALIDRCNTTSGYGYISTNAPARTEEISQVTKIYSLDSPRLTGRLQFVVSSDAGALLFNDLEEAVENFIKVECKGMVINSPIVQFKVLSEESQKGTSNSAVIYITQTPTHPLVQKFVSEYLGPKLQGRMVDVDLIGMERVASSNVHGMVYPNAVKAQSLFGEKPSTSHGELMMQVLFKAYQMGLSDLNLYQEKNMPIQEKKQLVNKLNEFTQKHVVHIWTELELSFN